MKFHENPSSGSRAVSCGRTVRNDEDKSRFSQFCETPKNDVNLIFFSHKDKFTKYFISNFIMQQESLRYKCLGCYVLHTCKQ